MAEFWDNLIIIPWYIHLGAIGMLALGVCYFLDIWGDVKGEWK